MNSVDLNKFYELGYTHKELESLLYKIENGSLLTKSEYDKLVTAIELIDGLTTFNGTYESLLGKPDIVDVVKTSGEFVTFEHFDAKARSIVALVTAQMQEFNNEIAKELEGYKNHDHDDRYSLLNHGHEERYAKKDDIKNFVTKDYLDSVIAGLGTGGGGGGGSIYPTYIEPVVTIKTNASYVTHKQKTTIVVTPEFSQNDAGDITKVTLRRNNIVVYESTELKNYSDEVTLKHGEKVSYTITVEYSDGIIKNTTEGDPYPSTSIKAGFKSKTIVVNGIANSYYGTIGDKVFDVSDISGLTAIRNLAKSFTMTYKLDNQKSIYMYPATYGELSSIKDINNFEYINSYTFSVITYDEVSYNLYIMTDSVTVSGSGFKQVFS